MKKWKLKFSILLLTVLSNIGITHVFHALTFAGFRESCLTVEAAKVECLNLSQWTRQVFMQ